MGVTDMISHCPAVGDVKTTQTQMEIFTYRFHNWCRIHSINHEQPVITKGHLNLTDYAELRLKAYASRVMTAYLAVVLKRLQSEKNLTGDSPDDLKLITAATAQFANWSLLLEKYPYDLSESQAQTLYDEGLKLLI